ncbi:MAG TPA: hypothetical protein VHE34_17290 [Puia sp.]|uniref:hypothetical protein n=1 Tax=Puia sp. TaxID=2045100 RepID=UPI002D0842C1|nr:hypothetical protein [Puia sp.]HVU96990.1 hypothetical protein [Puia sp.]
MEQLKDDFLSNLRRPRIVIADDYILISDPPFGWKIFLAFFCLLMALIVLESDKDSGMVGFVLCLSMAVGFIYDSLSLKRTNIDLKTKVIYRKSLNPLENLLGKLLKHPSKIPFSAIERIFADYTEAFGGATQRYFLYIRTDDPYNLKIGTFNKLVDAERVASYLARRLKA